MQRMLDGSIDLVVTSPPYWKGYEYEAYFNSYAQYLRWSKVWMLEIKRVLNPSGTFYLNITNDAETTTRAYELLYIATEELMYKLHETIIWNRYNQFPVNTDRQLTNQTEFIFMLRHTSARVTLNKEAAYNANPHIFETKNVGNIWRIPFNSKRRIPKGFGRHETKKEFGHSGFPIEIPETCILLSSSECGTVYDPFIGTGTTARAAIKHRRHYIGSDLFYDVDLNDLQYPLFEQLAV